jgi:hypothetical protein
MALQTARLTAVKCRSGYDFSFQPRLDRNRVLALAKLKFIDRPLGAICPLAPDRPGAIQRRPAARTHPKGGKRCWRRPKTDHLKGSVPTQY